MQVYYLRISVIYNWCTYKGLLVDIVVGNANEGDSRGVKK